MKRLCLDIFSTDLYDLFLFTEKLMIFFFVCVYFLSMECCIRGIRYEFILCYLRGYLFILLNCWIRFANSNIKKSSNGDFFSFSFFFVSSLHERDGENIEQN